MGGGWVCFQVEPNNWKMQKYSVNHLGLKSEVTANYNRGMGIPNA